LLSLRLLNRLQLDFQQVHPSHAVEVLSETYLPRKNEHLLWPCTFLDPLLVRGPY
jgi:hypothetical protein